MVQLNFDASQHAPMDNDPIPEGWYNFIIDESGAAPTKDGNPNHLRLNLRASVIDGPHKGRKVFIGLNIRHTNIQTMEIANRELSSIAAAVKLPYIQDTQQIHNIPFKGRVKITKDSNGVYDDRAEIKSYKTIDFVVPGVIAPIGVPQAAPQAAPQQAPQGWAPQAAPQQQYAPNGHAPQTMPQQPPNGGWQQPQQAQPWGQPQQAAPQAPQQATPLPPVQFAPNPQQAAPQQAATTGFAAPAPQPAPQQAPQAAPQPQDPAVAAAQQASPPWARQG